MHNYIKTATNCEWSQQWIHEQYKAYTTTTSGSGRRCN